MFYREHGYKRGRESFLKTSEPFFRDPVSKMVPEVRVLFKAARNDNE
jgi:hypothetical protein